MLKKKVQLKVRNFIKYLYKAYTVERTKSTPINTLKKKVQLKVRNFIKYLYLKHTL